MENKINELGPGNVSHHCSDPNEVNVIDIDPKSIKNPSEFESKVREHIDIRLLTPKDKDPAYHLEIPQPIKNDIEPTFIPVAVNDDETLWGLAQAFTGDGRNYQAIFEANKDVLANSDFITPGQTLRFPTDLMVVTAMGGESLWKSPNTVQVMGRIIWQYTTLIKQRLMILI